MTITQDSGVTFRWKGKLVQNLTDEERKEMERHLNPISSLSGHVKLMEDARHHDDKEKHIRPTWDEYFMRIMNEVSSRATCDRGRSGCVITKDNHILVTGYVGSPKGIPHCDEVGHIMKKVMHDDGSTSDHCVATAHAEQNAICQAAMLGIPLEKATLYCRMTPCRSCAQMIINCGISRIVCERKYQLATESEEMFSLVGIPISYIYNEGQEYGQ